MAEENFTPPASMIPPPEVAIKLDELSGWSNKRENQYGYWGAQLGLLYDDIADGKFGEAAKTGKWYLACKAAKDANPKPDIDALKNEIDTLIAAQESS